jgi:sugar lactone lactonase YvrE
VANQPPTEFAVASKTLLLRLMIVLVASGLFVWGLRLSSLIRDANAASGSPGAGDQIGSPAVIYDDRAYALFPCLVKPCSSSDQRLDYNIRIKVVDSGLIDGRGLAYDRNHARLIVADSWEGLFGYWPDYPMVRPEHLPEIRVCPGGYCQDVDHRGLLYDADSDQILVMDYHHQRLELRSQWGDYAGSIGGDGVLVGVTDAAIAEPGVYFVAATNRPAAEDPKTDKADGVIYRVTAKDARPMASGLERPAGVAFSRCQNRIYVSDFGLDAMTLYYWKPTSSTEWQRAGALATLPRDRTSPIPPLSGIVVAWCADQKTGLTTGPGGEVFAAGPGGLYVFHPDGTLLAKFVMTEPVTGLAWSEWRDDLYMTVGHRIAVLHTSHIAAQRPVLEPANPIVVTPKPPPPPLPKLRRPVKLKPRPICPCEGGRGSMALTSGQTSKSGSPSDDFRQNTR